jgi:hypothetical protein
MKGKTTGRKTTGNVVYFVLSAVSVFLIIGFVSLSAIGGAAAPADSGTEMALSQTKETTVGGTQTSGGSQSGIKVKKTFNIHQDKYNDYATDLHFKVWQQEDNIDINGWHIVITYFTDSDSQRGDQPEPAHSTLKNIGGHESTDDKDNGQHAVDVVADGAIIPYCTRVKVDVTFWLTGYNTIRLADVNWSKGSILKKATVDTGWEVGYPVPDAVNPGQYNHQLIITNDDLEGACVIKGLTYKATMDYYEDLTTIDYSTSPQVDDFYLDPGQSKVIDIATAGPLYGGHIYFKYDVMDYATETIIIQVLGGNHPITVAPLATY